MQEKPFISRVLNLEKGEGLLVLLPIIYSFFVGAAIAFFVTSVTSLFLNSFDRESLPISFVVAGVFVLLMGRAFSFLQLHFRFSRVLLIALGFLLVSTLSFLVFYYIFNLAWLIFVLYAWIRVFAYIHGVTFWGLAGRLFDLRQAKRLFGLITGGEVFASILSFFSIPFLLRHISTESILFISGSFLLFGFLLLLFIVRKFRVQLRQVKKSKTKNISDKKTGFFKNRYYKLFFIIAFLPIFAQFFVDFIFQLQAKIEFPEKEALTAFVAMFFGVSSIVEFVLKAFLSGRLMNKYGVRFGLLAFPVILLISFVLASTVGVLYGVSSLFFSLVALGRLFTRAIRTSFNDPATQILYQPLPKDERLAFQNKIESGPKAYASIFAGVFLFLFAKISWFSLVYFSIFLIFITILWTKIALNIYQEYKKIIQTVLLKKSKVNTQSTASLIANLLKQKIARVGTELRTSLYELHKNVFPFDNIELPENQIDKQYFQNRKKPFAQLVDFVDSPNLEERKQAARLLSNYPIYRVEKSLLKLMNDSDFDVRKQAIVSAGKMKELELFPCLLTNFQQADYLEVTFSSILHIGEAILPELNHFFMKLEYETKLQLKIIEAFEQIGGEKAIGFLRKRINYPNKAVRDRVIMALGKLNYKASKLELPYIIQRLEEEIYNLVYAAVSLLDFEELSDNQKVVKSMQVEKHSKRAKIFVLLSVIYDGATMQLISENLESEEVDATGFALEIADTVISEVHREMLLPLFESRTDTELVKKYKDRFPQEKFDVENRLIDIINSDSATTTYYTKATALQLLSNFDSPAVYRSLKMCLVHPSKIIYETAAIELYNKAPELFFEQCNYYRHRETKFQQLVLKVQNLSKHSNMLVMEKLGLLKSLPVFSEISENQLFSLVENSTEMVLKPNEKLLISSKNKMEIYIVLSGILEEHKSKQEVDAGKIISIYEKTSNNDLVFHAKEISFLLKTKIYFFNKLFAENITFVADFLQHIDESQHASPLHTEQ